MASDRPNGHVLGDTGAQSSILEAMTAEAPNYRAWLTSMALPYLGDDPIELGSGLGDYAQAWVDRGQPRITVTEAEETRLAHLRMRFANDSRVTVRRIDLNNPGEGTHSSFVSFNVLEHIPEDVAALEAARSLVRSGGYVFSFVPAFPIAMSDFDRQIGHVRRYRIKTMAKAMSAAGLQPISLRYINAPGLFAWILGMRVLGLNPGQGPFMSIWDARVVPVIRAVEQRWQMPFGQSVVAVGRVL
ncbi:MAG: methyltransferase domain-containing protein [Actinomycetota bacterium]|nr:methyltransferase domain-containing protein [Actinomycetota bacterium]